MLSSRPIRSTVFAAALLWVAAVAAAQQAAPAPVPAPADGTANAPVPAPAQANTAAAAAASTPAATTTTPASMPAAAPASMPEPAMDKTIHIVVGKSAIITSEVPLIRILSSNPTAVETVAISQTEVVVEGKAAGVSSLVMWDEQKHSRTVDISVDMDITALRNAINQAYPQHNINVETDGGRVVLSGRLRSQQLEDELVKMASQYSTQVVNSLTLPVEHERQVLLEVKFVEVDRTRIDQFGVNLLSTGAGNTPGVITTQQFSPPILGGSSSTGGVPGKLPLGVSDLLNIFLFRPDLNLGLTIKDLEQKNVLQILAEPNLMAISGQKATFLAGGEFPFPVVQSGQNGGAISVQFRPFGVRLDFTANVDSGKVVRLHVAPEVSTLDFTNAITVAGTTVPAISTRRAETEVELRDGQSFGIAGLLDNRAQTQLSKVPGIGDVPVLGQLFKSKNVNRSNTELLVLVTPRILNPVDANTPEPTLPQPAIPFLDKPKFDVKLPGNDNAKMPEPTQSPR